MKQGKQKCCLSILLLLLAGCGGHTARELIVSAVPLFKEAVVPVKDPLRARYQPAALKFRQTVIYASKEKGLEGENDTWDEAEPIEIIADGFCDIVQSDRWLMWDIKVRKMKIRGETASHPRLPLSHNRMWFDEKGNEQKVEVSLPAYDQTGIRDVMSKQRYAQLVNDTRQIAHHLIIMFTNGPVRSGDVLYGIKKIKIREMLEDQFETPGYFKGATGFKDIDFVLQGWSEYRGDRVLLATADSAIVVTVPARRKSYHCRVGGYVLLDPETFCLLKSVQIYTIELQYLSYEKEVRIVKINDLKIID